ncbi:CYTH domain-containing protein [Candidatus Gracilibacteria bacterium]|nr:CYTH domain-containing protein [Candidatus Gracilibacteria bacterium]
MLEVEIKILEIDQEKLSGKLEEMGAKKTFEGVIHDVYYDFPKGSKLKMEDNKRMFRIRKKGEEHIYTIKRKRKGMGKQQGAAIKDEHETAISNIDSFSKVIEKYGMTKTREKVKHRVSYAFKGAEFDIDKYEEIPAFLEIEEKSREHIDAWIKLLELGDKELLIGGSRKLFKHYGKEYLNFDWKEDEKK